MLNSYKNENRNNDRNELRILDYRNGKYQGTTLGLNMTRDGIGMIMDHNYLLTIASWRAGLVQGQVIIIFPDNTLFYGFMKNRFPFGMGCYQVSGKLQIYSFIGSGTEDLFVLDDNHNRNLILLAISREVMQKLYQEPTANQHILREQDGQIKEKTKINLRNEVNYSSKQEKWDTIEKFFKTVYKNEMKNYKDFIKHYFNSSIQSASAKIQVIQTKQEVQFNFINSSIMCKIIQSQDSQADFRIKVMGYYNHNERQFQICKKTYKNDLVEENINDSKIQYPFKKRPISCIKQTHQYYKKSLHFVNNFLQIDYLYRIKFIYHSIESSIGQISINKNAQKLLENTNEIKEIRHEKKSVSKQHSPNDPYSIQNLNKAKEDIYKAIKNKSQSRTKSISNSHIQYYPQTPSISRATNIQKNANKGSPYREQVDYKTKINDRRVSQHQPNTSPAGKRSYVYLEEDQNSRIRKRNSPAKFNYVGDALNHGRAQSKSNGKLTKYKYIQRDQKKQSVRIQNLAALTTYYQEIQNQLRKETTPRKSQRKFKNTDGITNKKYTYTYNLKEGQRENRLQLQAPQKTENPQPIGAKKVYKYG